MFLTNDSTADQTGQVQLGIPAVLGAVSAILTCVVFYFTQLTGVCTRIERNATEIRAIQRAQEQQGETLREVRTDIKALLKEATK